MMRVPLSRPELDQSDVDTVIAVLQSPLLSQGKCLGEFEAAFANRVQAAHAVACSSGTAGLHMVIRAYGVGEGDEVITTPFSFVATANCLLYERARPVFVDIDPDTLCITPEAAEAAITPKTRAILSVDTFGHPARLDEFRDLAERYNLVFIDDACEALGSEYRGAPVGSGRWAHASVFGFYPNKQITTGEGGCIVTDDEEIARICKSLRNQGRGDDGGWLRHERLGYNYRLDELSAALGVSQLRKLDDLIDRRARVAERYHHLLGPLAQREWLRLPYVAREVTRMSWFVYVVQLAPAFDRDTVIRDLQEAGVECRPYFPPIHLQPIYRKEFGYREGDFPVAEAAGRSGLALPFYPSLDADAQDYVVEALETVLKRQAN